MSIPKWLEENEFPGFELGNSISVMYDEGADRPTISVIGREVIYRVAGVHDKYLTLVPTHIGTPHHEKPFKHPAGRAAVLQINHDRIVMTMQYLADPTEESENEQ